MKIVIAMLLTVFSICSYADEHGEKGFKMEVNISGFFSPKVTKATISSVVQNSSAQQQGLQIGHQIVAIDDCQIPGCSASKAKKSLQKNVGEIVILKMLKPDGEIYQAKVTLQ